VTRSDDAFHEYLLDQGVSESTATVYARTARRWGDGDPVAWFRRNVTGRTSWGTVGALQAAVRHYLEFTGQPADVELLTKRERRQKPRQVQYREALTTAELAMYLDVLDRSNIPDPAFTILKLLPHTGLRISEACNMLQADVQRHRDRTVFTVLGKGNKKRVVPLSDAAHAILQEYLRANLAETQNSRFLFPSPHRASASVQPQTVRVHLRSVRGHLPGEAREVTPHVLRHTFATNLLESGVDIKVLQTLLGHTSITTTQKYLHPSVDMLGDAVDKL
jgi:integrase/recombinase XerD